MIDLLVLLHYYSIELHIIIDTVAVSLALLLAVFNLTIAAEIIQMMYTGTDYQCIHKTSFSWLSTSSETSSEANDSCLRLVE